MAILGDDDFGVAQRFQRCVKSPASSAALAAEVGFVPEASFLGGA
jgi:hypothetical protein